MSNKLWILKKLFESDDVSDNDREWDTDIGTRKDLGTGSTTDEEIKNMLDEQFPFGADFVFTVTRGKQKFAVELSDFGYRVHSIH